MHATALLSPLLSAVRIYPRRLLLDTTGVEATIPMLRGVWGAALHQLDAAVYDQVFDPAPAVPRYLLRPAPFDPQTAPALDWFLFADGIDADALLRRAWDIAAGRGLDKERRPFVVRRFLDVGPDGAATAERGPWALSEAAWPLNANSACRLVFPAPLRLLRDKRLIEQPTLADITVAAHRRVAAFLPQEKQGAWRQLLPGLLETARRLPGTWQGRRLDLQRWSARQQAEIDLRGVSGVLNLPQGVGELAPLLAAGCWVHLGKGTVFGLGQMDIEIISGELTCRNRIPS